MNIKHSKYKNTGILFELLVRQITADTLSGKNSKASSILKKYFVKTELGKEYKLYEIILKYNSLTEGKAEIIFNTVIETSKTLNRGVLKRQKYNLINEIKQHYDLNEFFKTQIPNYKTQAALYTLIEIYNSDQLSNPDQIINNKVCLLEHLTSTPVNKEKVKDDLLEEFSSYDKDIRILTYRILLERFNEKYISLNNMQKDILKEFITSVDNTPRLKEFYNQTVDKIKNELKSLSQGVKNKAVQIKLVEINKLLNPLNKISRVNNDDLINLLQYCQLIEELQKINE